MRAAWHCFGERGYGATTNREIGERANVSAPALYLYFESKTALYMEAVRAAYAIILPHFKTAIAPTHGLRDGLVALTRAYATGFALEPSAAPFLSSIPVEMQRHPEVRQAILEERHEVVLMIGDLVARGVKRGELRAEDAEGVIWMFLAGTMGLSLHSAGIGEERFYAAVEAFARLIAGTLIAPPR